MITTRSWWRCLGAPTAPPQLCAEGSDDDPKADLAARKHQAATGHCVISGQRPATKEE